MTLTTMLRRSFLGVGAAALLVAGCANSPSLQEAPPIVFVHGNGDTAALWQTTLWRFESNGWPRERLHAIEVPYPLARADDAKPQPGRTSTAQNTAYLKAQVETVLRASGADKVVLMGNSRGGNAIRDYIQNHGGDRTVSHAILGGALNHGAWISMPGLPDGSEFAGAGPFLTMLNRPKNANGDEVTGPVKWLTIRSDGNDKFAQPDGMWLGKKGQPTGITATGPELKGATNVVIPRIDHRETAYSPAAFAAAYQFITGHVPSTTAVTPEAHVVLGGRVTGLGVSSTDPKSGNFSNNLPLPGAQLQIYPTDAATGERRGGAAYSTTIGDDGRWGPFATQSGTQYEFVIAAPGYATTHIYRSPFPRSSEIVNMKPERIADADRDAAAIVTMTRPRGYLDPARDTMTFDGRSPPPGALPGAGVSSSKIKLASAQPRPVMAEFNGERVTGRVWPASQGELTLLELTD